MLRGLILIGLVAGSSLAKPSPQGKGDGKAADALDQLERVAAGGYGNSAANVDQSVLDELFGGGSNDINDGYKPPPKENQVILHFHHLKLLAPVISNVLCMPNWQECRTVVLGSLTIMLSRYNIKSHYSNILPRKFIEIPTTILWSWIGLQKNSWQHLISCVFTNLQVVDTTSVHCKDYSSQGYQCVPYYECDEYGEIILDGGEGLIDIRGAFGVNIELDVEQSKCPGYIDVCCRHPDFYKPVTPAAGTGGAATTKPPYVEPSTEAPYVPTDPPYVPPVTPAPYT